MIPYCGESFPRVSALMMLRRDGVPPCRIQRRHADPTGGVGPQMAAGTIQLL